MSHFTVVVRLPSEIARSALDEAVAQALLPFKESGFGDDDPEELQQYMEFEETEDTQRTKYETESVEHVRMPDGRLLLPWDDELSSPGADIRSVPSGATKIEIPYKQLFPTFEKFMEEWCEEKRDPVHNRYGYWHNPRAKWDWYQIGGRWDGFFPMPAGQKANFCRIKDIDLVSANKRMKDSATKFWAAWDRLLAGDKKEEDFIDGCRMRAVQLGLVECKDKAELTGNEWRTKSWEKNADRFDVYRCIDGAARDAYEVCFDPIASYSYLDPTAGWVAPGEMGWFGVSSDDPDSFLKYKRTYRDWLTSGNRDDWVVVVDCHI